MYDASGGWPAALPWAIAQAAGDAEASKERIDAQVDDRTLRELYLPAFEPVVTAGSPATVMSAYNATRVDTPLDALRAELGDDLLGYAAGYGADDATSDELLAEARATVEGADVAVVVVGLSEAAQSEGFDRRHLDLPEGHVALVRAVVGVARRTVVVLMNGGVVTLEPWHDDVDAIVEAWVLGQAVGGGLADVLTGRVNASGRLAETIPLALGDTPSFHTFPGEHEAVLYGERMFVGYRHYTTAGRAVRYPFGHGLSYTTFDRALAGVEVTGPDSARVAVSVRNTGRVAGADVVQVYVSPSDAPVARPIRELRASAKVRLEPGEERLVSVDLGRRAFAYWDVTRSGWRVQGGRYAIELGSSAHDIVDSLPLDLAGDTDAPPPLTLRSTVKQWFGHPVVGQLLLDGMLAPASPEERESAQQGLEMLAMVDSMPMDQFARMPMVGIAEETLAQLAELSRVGAG